MYISDRSVGSEPRRFTRAILRPPVPPVTSVLAGPPVPPVTSVLAGPPVPPVTSVLAGRGERRSNPGSGKSEQKRPPSLPPPPPPPLPLQSKRMEPESKRTSVPTISNTSRLNRLPVHSIEPRATSKVEPEETELAEQIGGEQGGDEIVTQERKTKVQSSGSPRSVGAFSMRPSVKQKATDDVGKKTVVRTGRRRTSLFQWWWWCRCWDRRCGRQCGQMEDH
jgi:hypothetical protein